MHDLRKNDRLFATLSFTSSNFIPMVCWTRLAESLQFFFSWIWSTTFEKKKSYPDIIGFTIFSTYTQKINQGLLQNWWVKTLFERVIKLMNNSWRLTKYNFISKYLEKTAQVQKHQKLFQHIALLFEVKILAAAKPYIHFCRHM